MYCRWMDQAIGKGKSKIAFIKLRLIKNIFGITILFYILLLLHLLGIWACLKGHIAIY